MESALSQHVCFALFVVRILGFHGKIDRSVASNGRSGLFDTMVCEYSMNAVRTGRYPIQPPVHYRYRVIGILVNPSGQSRTGIGGSAGGRTHPDKKAANTIDVAKPMISMMRRGLAGVVEVPLSDWSRNGKIGLERFDPASLPKTLLFDRTVHPSWSREPRHGSSHCSQRACGPLGVSVPCVGPICEDYEMPKTPTPVI